MLTIADEEHFRSKKNYCCNAFLQSGQPWTERKMF